MKAILVGALSIFVGLSSFAQSDGTKCSEFDNPKTDLEKIICGQELAHKCGFDYVKAQHTLMEYAGAPVFLRYLMGSNYIAGTTIGFYDFNCYRSLKMLTSIGAAADRPKELNDLIFFVGLTHLGSTVRALADYDKDGYPDPAFNACVDPHWAMASKLGEAMWEMYRASEHTNHLDVKHFRGFFDAYSAMIDITDERLNFLREDVKPSEYTNNHITGIRTAIGEGQNFGLGSCYGGNFASCICP